jgi:phosphoglycolate phosphatase
MIPRGGNKLIKTLIWDFNGTILDDLDLNFNTLTTLMKRRSLKSITKDEYLDSFCFPIIKYYEKLGFDFRKEPFEKVADEYFELYHNASLKLPLKDGVKETLKLLKKNNIKQVILSASNINYLTAQLNALEITGYFDEILGLSDVFAHSKVELAREWIRKSKLKLSEVILLGDTIHDYEVAEAAGICCVLVCGGHNSEACLKKTGAPVIKNVKEILNLFFK